MSSLIAEVIAGDRLSPEQQTASAKDYRFS
jgi:hypothetical protein